VVEIAVQRAPDADADLVRRHQAGDRTAFDEIVALHQRAVYRTARRLLDSHESADEAAQEAFVRAWRFLGRFRGESSLGTWLLRIVINVAKTMRGARRPVDALDDLPEPVDPREGSDERLGRNRLRARVRQAVSRLPPRQREVVVLKVFSELTHREVAACLGLTEGAVKAHLHQAVANLRRGMVDHGRARRA